MFITYEIDTYIEYSIYMSFTCQKKKRVLYIFHQEDSKCSFLFVFTTPGSSHTSFFYLLADSDFTLAAFKA